tara:strand:+ start:25505 stop:25939 length:435 start_codon:yes stop_codon:yes gene_type:complete
MRIVVQRVKKAKVIIESEETGRIDNGLLLLVCLVDGDSEEVVDKAAQKVLSMRIFSDQDDKMNLDIQQTGGAILAISQFTLAWDGQKGNRPSFDKAMAPAQAQLLFRFFLDRLREKVPVQTGRFGAHMNVELDNDGPVTFFLEF